MNPAWLWFGVVPALGALAGLWMIVFRPVTGAQAFGIALFPAVGLGLAKVVC